MKVKVQLSKNIQKKDDGIINRKNNTIFNELSDSDIYVVYAIGSYSNSIHYLIDALNDDRPFWYDADIFAIEENSIPPFWEVYNNKKADWTFLIGYHELVHNFDHLNDLLEREHTALDLFRSVKAHY